MSRTKQRKKAKNLPYQEVGPRLLAAVGERLKAGEADVGLRSLTQEVGTSTNAVYSLYGSKDILCVMGARQAFQDEYVPPAKPTVESVTKELHKMASKWPTLFRATHPHPTQTDSTEVLRPHVDLVALSATPLIIDQYTQAVGGNAEEGTQWWRHIYSYLAGATLTGEMPTLEETLLVCNVRVKGA